MLVHCFTKSHPDTGEKRQEETLSALQIVSIFDGCGVREWESVCVESRPFFFFCGGARFLFVCVRSTPFAPFTLSFVLSLIPIHFYSFHSIPSSNPSTHQPRVPPPINNKTSNMSHVKLFLPLRLLSRQLSKETRCAHVAHSSME